MTIMRVGDLDCYFTNDYFGPQWRTPQTFLLQHGYAANSNHFADWVPPLADSFRVIRRDAVGHGRTSVGAPGRDLSLPALAADVVAFLDANELESVHFVGERTGAMTGIVLAALHPERVRSLSIYGCPIECGTGLQRAMWAKLSAREQERYTGWSDAIAGLGGAFAWHDHVNWLQDPARPDYSAWQTDQLHLCDEDLLERYAEATMHYSIAEYLPAVTVPTLIMGPTSTYRTNLEQQLKVRESLVDSELEIVEGGEGRSDDGNGPRLARRVRRFLADRGLE